MGLTWLGPGDAAGDDELDEHRAAIRRQIEDPHLALLQRQILARQLAETLDRAAQSSGRLDEKRQLWRDAAGMLERFNRDNSGHADARLFGLQASVYRWAEARSWAQQFEASPSEADARTRAIAGYDQALQTLRPFARDLERSDELIAQNVRYRLAQVLLDRARLLTDEPDRRRTLEEALNDLHRPVWDPAVKGLARLLQAEILVELGQFDAAQVAWDDANRHKPGLPAPTLVEDQVAIQTGKRQFAEALETLSKAAIDPTLRDQLALRVHLARSSAAKSPADRAEALAESFRTVRDLREASPSAGRAALIALARAVEEPGTDQSPDDWDLLAEGQLILGHPGRAAGLEQKGAEKAEARKDAEKAASLRYRAGAILFQAGRYREADRVLQRVVKAGRAGGLAAKASLLVAIARGRAWSAGEAGATREAYLEALESHLHDFASDPTSGEARWLLGELKAAQGATDEAVALWKSIPRGDPRGVDALVAIARTYQDELDDLRTTGDRSQIQAMVARAQAHLKAALAQPLGNVGHAAVELQRVRLDLTPGVGHPEEALDGCDRTQPTAALPAQRSRFEAYRLVAMTQLGRFFDAEQQWRDRNRDLSAADLLELSRLLDESAAIASSDVAVHRYGKLLAAVAEMLLKTPGGLSPAETDEAELLHVRGLIFAGEYPAARKEMEKWAPRLPALPAPRLERVADTYFRLEDYPNAVSAYQTLVKRLPSGKLAWFRARYGLAMSYYRLGRRKDAERLIDATVVLHPGFGGELLREKAERLRQRLAFE